MGAEHDSSSESSTLQRAHTACMLTVRMALHYIMCVRTYVGEFTVDKSLLFKGDFQMDSFTFNFYCGEPSLVSAICVRTYVLAHTCTYVHNTCIHTPTLTYTQHAQTPVYVISNVHVRVLCLTQAMIINCKTEVLSND